MVGNYMEHTFATVIESRRKHNLYDNALRETLNTNLSELSVLNVLAHAEDGKSDVASIQDTLGIPASTIGSIIRTLKQKGLIQKQRREDNERYIEIFIKPEQVGAVNDMLGEAELLIEDAFSDKPVEDDAELEDEEVEEDDEVVE